MREFDAADARFTALSGDQITGIVVYAEKACHHWNWWAWILDRLDKHNHTRILDYYDQGFSELPPMENGDSMIIEYDGRGLAKVSLTKEMIDDE